MSRTGLVVLGTSAVSLAAGAGLGYFFTKKQLEKQYAELSEREIAEAKKFYSLLYKKTDNTKTPQDAATSLIPNGAEAAKALLSYQGNTEETSVVVGTPNAEGWTIPDHEDEEEEPKEIVRNVFEDPDAPSNFPDFEVEVRNRTEEAPYVITQQEALEEERYMQSTFTYFAGDGILVDERDAPIEEVDSTVGLDNLVKFGMWSNDPNIVYVRNDVLEMVYEIVRSQGKYAEDVLGLVPQEEQPKPKAPRRRTSKARTGGGDDG